jgi:diadenosine tetraphosphatase ApaH/serine/threonine PP2A family protein phosphatase
MGETDRLSFSRLDRSHLDWLRSLPQTTTVWDDVFLCHETPTSDEAYWLERVSADGRVRPASRSEVELAAEGIAETLILCAHTHIPRSVRLRDGRMIINPGSVGCPAYEDDVPVPHLMQTGTPNASYAIVEGTGFDRRVTFRSVPYPFHDAAGLASANGREDWARALASGWIEP